MAPPRLAEFVQRPAEFDELLRLLLTQNRESPVAITAALRGAGGYGKTTLATAICHDQQIINKFKHGILWVTLGESASQQTLINEITFLSCQLSGERESFTSLNEATNRLIELLGDRDLLLVIDDVWNLDHARPFLQGGPRCARLITTRNLNTLPTNARAVKVDAMKRNEAAALLGAGFEKYTDLPTVRNELNALAERLGEWPLLLKLANGALRNRTANGDSFRDALEFIKADLEENGLTTFDSEIEEERNRAVSATLGVSFKLLKESDLARFNELAVFPEDVDIPLATVEKFWSATGGLSRVNSQKLCERLHSLSLLLDFSLREKIIRLHDVIRKYLIEQGRDRLPSIHNRLLESHRTVSTSSDPPVTPWSELPDDKLYLWDHLAFHLIEANRGGELVATVKDWRYLAKKALLRRSHAVENDLVRAEKIAPDDDQLRTLRRGISLSSHLINRCKTKHEVESTLLARLRHLTDLTPTLEDLAQNLNRPYLTSQTLLPDLPHPALIRTLEGHSGYVNGCAFSPDGRLVISASDDRTLRVWDVLAGETVRVLEGHSGGVRSCAFSPDGRLIVSASDDRALRVWDALIGETLRTLEGHSDAVMSCVFSPNGKLIVSASDDRTLRVWDALAGEAVRVLEGHSGGVRSCAFSPDGRLIVSASDDHTLRVWDALTGETLHVLEDHPFSVTSCAFSPDGKLIVSASWDGSLKVWDVVTGKPLRAMEDHSEAVMSCAFSPDGRLIVSASIDRTLKVWSALTGEMLRTLEGHSFCVMDCAFSPDGGLIISASLDGPLRVWDVLVAETLRTLESYSGLVMGHALSPDTGLIVLASSDSTLRVWDALTGETLRTLKDHSNSLMGCAFSPDGRLIVSVSFDHTLWVWDALTGETLRTLEGHLSYINGCAFGSDSSLFVSASSDLTLRVWDVLTGETLRTLEGHSAAVEGCAFSPDSKLIVSASSDRTLRVWDVLTGETLRTLEGHSDRVHDCAFGPDGRLIVSASSDRTLRVWDALTGKTLHTLEGHSDSVRSCAFSPDGRLIVSASSDRALKVWNALAGQLLTTFFADEPMFYCAVYEDMIVGGGYRGTYLLRLVR